MTPSAPSQSGIACLYSSSRRDGNDPRDASAAIGRRGLARRGGGRWVPLALVAVWLAGLWR
jgi:hypothetical protein